MTMIDARNYSAQETLKNGLQVTIRSIRPDDGEALLAAFKELEGRKDLIQAEIIVERDSQKGILIGKDGAALKEIVSA